MAEMRALQVTRNGPPGEVLAVREVDRPVPGDGQVLVEVAAASLNFNDIDRCLGKLVSVPTPPPYTLGMDVCGVVVETGAGAEQWLGQAGRGHHHHRPRRHRRVRAGRRGVGVRRPGRPGRRRGHRLHHAVPHLPPRPLPTGTPDRRRDPGGALGGQRAGHRRDPAGQGGGRPGDRRRRRSRQGCAVCVARGRSGDRPHHDRLRRGGARGDRRRRRRRRLRPDRRRLRRAVVAVHGPGRPLPGRRVRRRRRERDDRPAACAWRASATSTWSG